ncbi:MAG: N-acetyltransferase, partial [Bacillus sp. (in: Bacteria)]|nr:N-acetyltransferase [Bacillus sp. (in: firmicutes)]
MVFESFRETSSLCETDEEGNIYGWLSFETFYGRPAYNGTVEMSIYLNQNYRGKGLGSLFLQEALELAPSLGIRTLLAFIFGHNEA